MRIVHISKENRKEGEIDLSRFGFKPIRLKACIIQYMAKEVMYPLHSSICMCWLAAGHIGEK